MQIDSSYTCSLLFHLHNQLNFVITGERLNGSDRAQDVWSRLNSRTVSGRLFTVRVTPLLHQETNNKPMTGK